MTQPNPADPFASDRNTWGPDDFVIEEPDTEQEDSAE